MNAWAQWQWVDAQGQKVFSDRAPSADVPEKNILQRPKTVQPQDAPKNAAAAATPANSAPPTANAVVDKNKAAMLDLNTQLAEQNKASRARNCTEARRQLGILKSGVRIAKINDKGDREFLDDAAIAAEIKQFQRTADSECQ